MQVKANFPTYPTYPLGETHPHWGQSEMVIYKGGRGGQPIDFRFVQFLKQPNLPELHHSPYGVWYRPREGIDAQVQSGEGGHGEEPGRDLPREGVATKVQDLQHARLKLGDGSAQPGGWMDAWHRPRGWGPKVAQEGRRARGQEGMHH